MLSFRFLERVKSLASARLLAMRRRIHHAKLLSDFWKYETLTFNRADQCYHNDSHPHPNQLYFDCCAMCFDVSERFEKIDAEFQFLEKGRVISVGSSAGYEKKDTPCKSLSDFSKYDTLTFNCADPCHHDDSHLHLNQLYLGCGAMHSHPHPSR